MSNKIEITGLKLKTRDGKTVNLSLAEAKELHEQLDNLFGKKTVYIPSNPIVIDRYSPYWYDHSKWTLDSGTSSMD